MAERANVSPILIVDDETVMREFMRECLEKEGYFIEAVASVGEARAALEHSTFDVLITDVSMPGETGLALIADFRKKFPLSGIVVVTAFPKENFVPFLEEYDVTTLLTKPFTSRQLKFSTLSALEQYRSGLESSRIPFESYDDSNLGFVGSSSAMQQLRNEIVTMAAGEFPVLIDGESGTGKELVAHAIHNLSTRKEEPMLTVNCGAVPRHLEESEFFGYVKGAFTGASSKKTGILESANNSTVFLDEIGELSLPVQAKLLRVLDTGEFLRIGDTTPSQTNIRVVSATNRSLESMIEQGHFRKDLYFRLKGATITVPPLRTHPEDIPELVLFFLKVHAGNEKTPQVTPEALDLLIHHAWPGNVRELKHSVNLLLTVGRGSGKINEALIFSTLKLQPTPQETIPFHIAKEQFERSYFSSLLRKHKGNMTQAALDSQMHRPNLFRKLKMLHISAARFKE